eukprot:TRINITY_DN7299_c0_g1_i8.p1 TRINITY_DN7299_c0_g1~~TRINITY_DN7299_c0_g1_i8.p1  ORF type:complete len:372 (+),score=59.55 TRINITY_DN7299_c0_g1_i8:216-1331(+)
MALATPESPRRPVESRSVTYTSDEKDAQYSIEASTGSVQSRPAAYSSDDKDVQNQRRVNGVRTLTMVLLARLFQFYMVSGEDCPQDVKAADACALWHSLVYSSSVVVLCCFVCILGRYVSWCLPLTFKLRAERLERWKLDLFFFAFLAMPMDGALAAVDIGPLPFLLLLGVTACSMCAVMAWCVSIDLHTRGAALLLVVCSHGVAYTLMSWTIGRTPDTHWLLTFRLQIRSLSVFYVAMSFVLPAGLLLRQAIATDVKGAADGTTIDLDSETRPTANDEPVTMRLDDTLRPPSEARDLLHQKDHAVSEEPQHVSSDHAKGLWACDPAEVGKAYGEALDRQAKQQGEGPHDPYERLYIMEELGELHPNVFLL